MRGLEICHLKFVAIKCTIVVFLTSCNLDRRTNTEVFLFVLSNKIQFPRKYEFIKNRFINLLDSERFLSIRFIKILFEFY